MEIVTKIKALYLFIFLLSLSFRVQSQEIIYLMFDENKNEFKKDINIEVKEDPINYQYNFHLQKVIGNKFNDIEEEIAYTFKWSIANIDFVHNKYVDTTASYNVVLKEKFIYKANSILDSDLSTLKNIDQLSINELYKQLRGKAVLLDKENNINGFLDFRSKVDLLDNLYYNQFKFYDSYLIDNQIEKIKITHLEDFSCIEKFIELKKRLFLADIIYIVVKKKNIVHFYEVAILNKIKIY